MNARFYNANTGRFLTQDTYRGNAYEPMSQNLYTYCGNNPTTMIDPTGHFYYDANGQQSSLNGSDKAESTENLEDGSDSQQSTGLQMYIPQEDLEKYINILRTMRELKSEGTVGIGVSGVGQYLMRVSVQYGYAW